MWTFRWGLLIGTWLAVTAGWIFLWFTYRQRKWDKQTIQVLQDRIRALKARQESQLNSHSLYDLEATELGKTNVFCTTCMEVIGTISDPVFFGELAEAHYREKVTKMAYTEPPAECETPADT